MDEFRVLLDRFWIRREEDRELFYQVRRKLPALRREAGIEIQTGNIAMASFLGQHRGHIGFENLQKLFHPSRLDADSGNHVNHLCASVSLIAALNIFYPRNPPSRPL